MVGVADVAKGEGVMRESNREAIEETISNITDQIMVEGKEAKLFRMSAFLVQCLLIDISRCAVALERIADAQDLGRRK